VSWVIERDGVRESLGHNDLTITGLRHALDLIFTSATPRLDSAHAYIGVGDSQTPFSSSQTDLQATTNKVLRPMDATYPSRSAQTVTLRATFGSSQANFDWKEWGIYYNDGSPHLFSRRVQSLGTKTSPSIWRLYAEVTLS
jgi:hypothetical protein